MKEWCNRDENYFAGIKNVTIGKCLNPITNGPLPAENAVNEINCRFCEHLCKNETKTKCYCPLYHILGFTYFGSLQNVKHNHFHLTIEN